MQDLTDSTLLKRCISGDKVAWDKFVERFSQLIYWAIRKRLGAINYLYNQQDLEDIFQNVFILLWEKGKLKQIRNRDRIAGWLAMVAANCAANYSRGKREGLFEKEPLPQDIASFDCGPPGRIDQEKLSGALEEALSFISAPELIALKLSYLYGKTHQEIGQILKMPASTVSSIIKRVKEKLKLKLKQQGWENF